MRRTVAGDNFQLNRGYRVHSFLNGHDRQAYSVSSMAALMSFLDGGRYEEPDGSRLNLLHLLDGSPAGFTPEEASGPPRWWSARLLELAEGKKSLRRGSTKSLSLERRFFYA